MLVTIRQQVRCPRRELSIHKFPDQYLGVARWRLLAVALIDGEYQSMLFITAVRQLRCASRGRREARLQIVAVRLISL